MRKRKQINMHIQNLFWDQIEEKFNDMYHRELGGKLFKSLRDELLWQLWDHLKKMHYETI